MGCRQRLYGLLGKLGIYRLSRSRWEGPPQAGEELTLVECELESYLLILEGLERRMEQLLQDCFALTAGGERLAMLERQLGIPVKEELEWEGRRRRVADRLSIGASDFHREGVLRALRSAGVDCQLEELPEEGRLRVTVGQVNAGQLSLSQVKATVAALLPAHLLVELEAGGFCWEELDRAEKTWNQLDALDRTWEQLELLGVQPQQPEAPGEQAALPGGAGMDRRG